MNFLLNQIASLSEKPAYSSEEYKHWIGQEDFVCFLQAIPSSADVVLYVSVPYFTYIYGVLVPGRLVSPTDIDDLDHWRCHPFSSWGIATSYGERKSVSVSRPLNHTGSKTLDRGEQIIFARDFDGRQENRSYIEISQKLTHAFGLHYVTERDSFCRFDARGDVEDVIRVLSLTGQSSREDGRVVTILRDTLDEYLVITRQILLLLFDSTRFEPKSFGGWQNQDVEYHQREPEIYYRMGRSSETSSYIRGFQVIRPFLSKKAVKNRHGLDALKGRQYTSFIAHDWKHDTICECSCDPKLLGNYFVVSNLPYEISPAFFRPEVLQKYKSDTEKYQLGDRSITCRHAWHLETYDVNDAGQVHTYLKYLSYLPYEEQLYWKSFNESPKGRISRRAFQTDFEGRWDLEYDSLKSLRGFLRNLHETPVSWWKLRENNLLRIVHYPITNSADEWSKELHTLDKLLVEGFETRDLRERVANLGRTVDKQWKSLKLIEEVLRGLSSDEDHIKFIIEPIREVHTLRSKLSGHASGKEAKQIKIDILKKHNTYSSHFRDLCTRCDRAIRDLRSLLEPKVI
jgi:hypothetical protein